MNEPWPFLADPRTATIVSRHIFDGGPICFAYHDWNEDSWQFLPERVTEDSDVMIVASKEAHQLDDTIRNIADLPHGWMASRADRNSPWKRRRNHPFPTFTDHRFCLDDAEAYEQAYPGKYQIPSKETRKNLKVGEVVKLIFRFADEWASRKDDECERMWVEITEVDQEKGHYRGILLNTPYTHAAIDSGHKFWFHPTHVFDIHHEADSQTLSP